MNIDQVRLFLIPVGSTRINYSVKSVTQMSADKERQSLGHCRFNSLGTISKHVTLLLGWLEIFCTDEQ